jgi:radical SAM superfamily enzyme YgiQ (UPF0313 family)
MGRNDILEIIHAIKNKNLKVKIVAGGAKSTLVSKFQIIDHIVVGQGETTVKALTKSIINNEEFPRVVTDKDFPFDDFNSSIIEYQPQDIINDREHLIIETARGCIFKCSFCTYPLNGKRIMEYTKQPTVLAAEMTRNYELFKTQGYMISDDTLNDSVEKIEMLHNAITKLPFNVILSSYARLDLIISHPKTLDLMYEMGSRSFFFGIETFNKQSGQAIGKGMDPDKIKKGLDYIKNRYPDILLTGSFIYGLPYDTIQSLKDTTSYLDSSPLDSILISPLVLSPNSMMGANPLKHGYDISDGFNKWRNNFMTYRDAKELTIEAINTLRHRNKVNALHMHRMINSGFTIEDCHAMHMSRKNLQAIEIKTKQLQENYLTKLLAL